MAIRFKFFAVLAAVSCATSGIYAQEGANAGAAATVNAAAQTDGLSVLAASVQRLDADIAALSSKYVTREEFAKLQEIVTKQTGALDTLQRLVGEQGTKIDQIDEKYNLSITALNEQATHINQILEAISRTDSQGQPILNVANAMKSADFRQELAGAVDQSLATHERGTLTVTNNMHTLQILRINGETHFLEPYRTYQVPVRVGTVTTELAGEAPKNWTIAPPLYSQGIVIAPRQAPIYITGLLP